MNSDGYLFFTETHRLYVQGVRQAFSERLAAAFGDEWWERGVESALQGNLLKSLQDVVEKNPNHDRHLFIETSHFAWIIVKHHNEVFSDAFGDTVRTFNDLRRLNEMRNEWAHIHDISPARGVQAADLMKSILASLRREEALEIQRMSQEFVLDPNDRHTEDTLDLLNHEDNGLDPRDSAVAPLDFWRQLQSYLVLEKLVEMPDGPEGRATVNITVHNTAPDNNDWPAIHYSSVFISTANDVRSGDHRGYRESREELGELGPGQSRKAVFSFAARELVSVEFTVYGRVDGNRLWEFQRPTGLPAEVVAPFRSELANLLDSIAIKEFVGKALEEIGAPSGGMTLAEISTLRENIRSYSGIVEEKRESLRALMRSFHLDEESTLGARTGEIATALNEFQKKLGALDEAIGQTNLDSITQAINDLKQIQLAVLRVEDTVRTITRSD